MLLCTVAVPKWGFRRSSTLCRGRQVGVLARAGCPFRTTSGESARSAVLRLVRGWQKETLQRSLALSNQLAVEFRSFPGTASSSQAFCHPEDVPAPEEVPWRAGFSSERTGRRSLASGKLPEPCLSGGTSPDSFSATLSGPAATSMLPSPDHILPPQCLLPRVKRAASGLRGRPSGRQSWTSDVCRCRASRVVAWAKPGTPGGSLDWPPMRRGLHGQPPKEIGKPRQRASCRLHRAVLEVQR